MTRKTDWMEIRFDNLAPLDISLRSDESWTSLNNTTSISTFTTNQLTSRTSYARAGMINFSTRNISAQPHSHDYINQYFGNTDDGVATNRLDENSVGASEPRRACPMRGDCRHPLYVLIP